MKIPLLFLLIAIHAYFSNCQSEYKKIKLSTPEECARNCSDFELPKNCYYKFHVEFYTTVGPACDKEEFQKQCILADGVEKTMLSINRQLPGPPIEACLNDRIIVDLTNAAPGLSITIHWHGLFQKGYQYYDGVPFITQCPIQSSNTFRYNFKANNAGTFFYHSHMSTHILDGQYGSLIIRKPPSQNKLINLYDVDNHTILISDWMHELSLERYPGWYRHDQGQTAKNILINGLGNWTDPDTKKTTNGKLAVIRVKPGLRHRLRLINSFSTVCLTELRVEGHKLTVISQDGADVKPKVVQEIITGPAERVDFILNATKEVKSYWIQVRGLGACEEKEVQQLAILQYEGAPSTPSSPRPSYNVSNNVVYNSLNGTKCNTKDDPKAVCVNQLEGLECDPDLFKIEPDARHVLDLWFYSYSQSGGENLFGSDSYPRYLVAGNGAQLASMLNGVSFENPHSPFMSQSSSYETVCKPNQPSTCTEPCSCTQVINIKKGAIVEFVVYDRLPIPGMHHPFHLHGFEFKIFAIGQFPNATNISRADIDDAIAQHTDRLKRGEYTCPPGKDTAKIPSGGYIIFRFKADNPGWWLLHCHFLWHHLTGMELVLRVGNQSDLPPVPRDFPKCDNWLPPLRPWNNFHGFQFPNHG